MSFAPLTAAIGRLQGMLDGVFDASPEQLAMVMKQLQHLNRLTDELICSRCLMPGIWCWKTNPFVWMSCLKNGRHGSCPRLMHIVLQSGFIILRRVPSKAIRSVWARFSPFLWKMPSVTGVMAVILMSRCTTPAGNIASNFAMTARGILPVPAGNVQPF